MKALKDFALAWGEMGPTEFSILYGKPVLIGTGTSGDLSQSATRMRTPPSSIISRPTASCRRATLWWEGSG